MTDYKHVEAKLPSDRDAQPIPVLRSADSINGTASGVADNDNALPSGTQIVMVSATESVWIKFGGSGVTVSAAEAGAILIPGGGVTLSLNSTETHVAFIRAGLNDATVSFSKMV